MDLSNPRRQDKAYKATPDHEAGTKGTKKSKRRNIRLRILINK